MACFFLSLFFLHGNQAAPYMDDVIFEMHWVIDIPVSEGKFILIGRSELSFAAWEQKELSWVRAVLSQDFTALTDNTNLSSRILIPCTVLKDTTVFVYI